MDAYLDTKKSVVISSPAGSGKTEKLARRYISLLNDSEIEKILCITFTEKAAAEMKERILNILEKENPDLFLLIKEKMPLMRISTIHAFCLKLLKRFSIELGVDPSLDVMDEFEAALLWSEAVYESMVAEREKPAIFMEMMKDRGIKGWEKISSLLDTLYGRRPASELLLKEGCVAPDSEEGKILGLFSNCLELYRKMKAEKHLFDFNDLEIMVYDALIKHPEWQNILYAFDEHTDHILVDEFQDTSSVQWKIIDKLTEEWRSGIGSKRSSGKTPTIFLVGDDKQSIYLFRGANAGVFQEAKHTLSEWLGEEYRFEEARENYRSLPAIINFTNILFERLMPRTLHEAWKTGYAAFEATRTGEGRVELVLTETGENTKKSRAKEAYALSRRIRSLAGKYRVFDDNKERPCSFGDMAILLRKRTHLYAFEAALRKEQIPFVIVKGIGFYDEPEVAVLRELLSFIVDPMDDYSLCCVLRSPFFNMDYETLLAIMTEGKDPLFRKLQGRLDFFESFKTLNEWVERYVNTPLAILLEHALIETKAWRRYWEKQRRANIKKFIKLVESYESSGFSGLEIREKLIKARYGDEPKANINTEGMNAVKIMTIHAAKGLQFPMVFLPSLDEADSPRSSSIAIDEEEGSIMISCEEDSSKRKKNTTFARRKEKESEEGKRIFYVAVTRARDFLCMLGALDTDKGAKGRLSYLTENFEIIKKGKINKNTEAFEIITEAELENLYSSASPATQPSAFSPRGIRLSADSLQPSAPLLSEQVYIDAISFEPSLKWRDVTEDSDIRITHGEDWVLLGRIFHKLFEELSKGILIKDNIKERGLFLIRNEALPHDEIDRLSNVVLKDFAKLEENGQLENIILPRDNSFSEMPFILQKGNTVFKGRVDRIIIEDNIALIYDYKTFPVKDSELPDLVERYRFQMEIYKEAVSKILSLNAKSYLLFTHRGLVVEV